MRIVRVDKGCFIPIGRLGEKESTMVIFDISDWKTIYGDGIFSLMCQRNGESAPYIAVIEQTETEVHWVVKDVDVGIKGYGKCELIYTVGDAIAKSEIYGTVVGDALQGGSVPPEPWEDWVERVLAAGAAAQDAAVSAEHSAEVASEKAGEAETSAINANISAQAAQDAANSMSFVSFDIDQDGDLYINRSEHLGTTAFELNENGELEVEI